MKDRAFFDTNILIYADDSSFPAQQSMARGLILEALRNERAVLSTQVMMEYSAALVKRLGFSPAEAADRVRVTANFECVSITPEVASMAFELMRRHPFSVWDAAIVAAASFSDCRILFSEDMQHGFRLDGLTIVNPFE